LGVPSFNARMNQVIVQGCNWNDGNIQYSELEIVLHRRTSFAIQIYCFGHQKTQFSSGRIDLGIHITQQGCPPLTDLSLPAISCTFVSHKPKHVCALRASYSLAQLLNYYTLTLQCANCPAQPAYHWCFTDDEVISSSILLQWARDKVRLDLHKWWPQITGEDWNFFRPCGVKWDTVVHSGDIQE